MSKLASPKSSNKSTKTTPQFSCDICNKLFTRQYNLKSHKRTHTNERPFECTVCGKSFARQHDRKRHEDLHTGLKRYQCKGTLKDGSSWGCGKRFARTDALRRHFQTESGKECIRPLIEENKSGAGGNSQRSNNNGDLNSLNSLDNSDDLNFEVNNILEKLVVDQSSNAVAESIVSASQN